jgi:hypothetical protein
MNAPGYVIDLSGAGGPIVEGRAQDIGGHSDARHLPPASGPADEADGDDDGVGE